MATEYVTGFVKTVPFSTTTEIQFIHVRSLLLKLHSSTVKADQAHGYR